MTAAERLDAAIKEAQRLDVAASGKRALRLLARAALFNARAGRLHDADEIAAVEAAVLAYDDAAEAAVEAWRDAADVAHGVDDEASSPAQEAP